MMIMVLAVGMVMIWVAWATVPVLISKVTVSVTTAEIERIITAGEAAAAAAWAIVGAANIVASTR